MKPERSLLRSLLPLVVLAIFVAAALLWQHYDRDSGGSQSCAEMIEQWEGPIPFGGPASSPAALKPLERAAKIAEFTSYPVPIRSLSVATRLTKEVFKDSIKENLAAPYAVRYQLYNYVVTTECEIRAATWTDKGFSAVLSDKKICVEDERRIAAGNIAGTMINFFPEDLGSQFREMNINIANQASRSPCWLSVTPKKKKGILDALSKHFMLAQKEGSMIQQFDATKWQKTELAYAGEILVDLKNCTYSLNNGSGTYRPFEKHVPSVTRFVAEKIIDGSLAISDIKPWC